MISSLKSYRWLLVVMILCLMFWVTLFITAKCAVAGTDITFAWDKSDGAAGYHVYTSPTQVFTKTSPKVCTAVLEPLRTCTAINVPDGLMWYAATAYDAAGNESDFSNSISYNGDTTPPIKPPNFREVSVKVNVTVTFAPAP